MAGFGIPEHLVAAPIAGDWEAFNVRDNNGEIAAPWDPATASHAAAAAHAGHDDHEPAGHGHLTPGGPPAF